MDVVGKGKQRLCSELLSGLTNGRVAADGAVVEEEENPDDAAIQNTGIGLTMTLPRIFHAQLDNLGVETASTSVSVAVLPS